MPGTGKEWQVTRSHSAVKFTVYKHRVVHRVACWQQALWQTSQRSIRSRLCMVEAYCADKLRLTTHRQVLTAVVKGM